MTWFCLLFTKIRREPVHGCFVSFGIEVLRRLICVVDTMPATELFCNSRKFWFIECCSLEVILTREIRMTGFKIVECRNAEGGRKKEEEK
jgi:hypothetical protein